MKRPGPVRFGAVSIHDRLLVTLFLAGLFHLIIILGVTFAPPERDASFVPTLEVLLVGNALPDAPINKEASYLAERTQQGSGNIDTGASRRPGSTGAPEDSRFGVEDGSGPRSLAGPAGGEASILTGAGTRTRFIADAADPSASLPSLPRRAVAGDLAPLAGSENDPELLLKGTGRSELLVTPSTRASDVAVYLDAWKRRVEQVGTLNFPNEARRHHLSGDPVIEVALAATGALLEVEVRRTSGHPELDTAAIAILRLATPFEAFPVELATRHDVLRFAYEWQFVAGRLAGSAVDLPAD
ncbi:MAG TPA: TonB family protein [Steroidobacteraceae bacterium]|nr:TonB family protein [Steroidobacteraceae bacterium]